MHMTISGNKIQPAAFDRVASYIAESGYHIFTPRRPYYSSNALTPKRHVDLMLDSAIRAIRRIIGI